MRKSLAKTLFKLFPFDPRGDCAVHPAKEGIQISCIINFFGRIDLLQGILFSLSEQDFDHERLEVILVEDRGGTPDGKRLAEEFRAVLPIRYASLDKNYGLMGYSRNFGLSLSEGKYILFLDDDTVVLQKDFLRVLVAEFESNPNTDAVIPHGKASFATIRGKYDYHIPFFMSSRCMAYRRNVLKELSGFYSNFVGQEDVEFAIRFFMTGKKCVESDKVVFFHPPHVLGKMSKAMAVGMSFASLRKRYPLLLFAFTITNGARHAPLYLIPIKKFREMGRFGLGFLAGVLAAPFKKEGYRYG